jgi:hypothetical protein
MKQRRLTTAARALGLLLTASPLLVASSAWAGPCVTASVATYEASGFSCSVGSVTFSNIVVTTPTSGSGTVALGSFSPFTSGTENGLSLSYSANTGTTANSAADVAWTYNVSGLGIEDAFMSFTGTTIGTGSASLSETLSNGATLSLTHPGSTSTTFPSIDELSVLKDQNDFSGPAGSAETSLLQNGFSVDTPVTEPGTLALLATACLGLGWFGRHRKRM